MEVVRSLYGNGWVDALLTHLIYEFIQYNHRLPTEGEQQGAYPPELCTYFTNMKYFL